MFEIGIVGQCRIVVFVIHDGGRLGEFKLFGKTY